MLPKNMLIAVGVEQAETIIAYDRLGPSSNSEGEEVRNIVWNDQWALTERPQQVTTKDEKRMMHEWGQELQNDSIFPEIVINS